MVAVMVSGPVPAEQLRYPVSIITPDGSEFVYRLELAATPDARSRGLMYRTDLPENGGMLFVWPDEKERSFWMKNTPLSLDILFFSSERKLISLYESTTPYSQKRLLSGLAARYVVELTAGQAGARGLREGSVLQLPEKLAVSLSSQE